MNRVRKTSASGIAAELVLALAGAAALVASATAIASAQSQKEIAVMLPAAGDPYFKLKACGYTEAGKQAGYDVKIYDAGGYGNLEPADFADPGCDSTQGQRHCACAGKF